jgi:POT family proton-dependent oligopeptide transporter
MTSIAQKPAALSGEFMGHPKGLYVLFFAEMWERFNYYGMRALLIFYMTKVFLFKDDFAALSYGAYTGLVYATPLLGGMLADRILGYRRAIILGGILMAIGEFALAAPGFGWMPKTLTYFYGGLALIIIGNGFFKPNISTMVGTLYKPGDARRDSAFTIFYMGINIGATAAPLICGYVGETWGYHYGFLIAGIGMVLGLLSFITFQGMLGEKGLPPGATSSRSVALSLRDLMILIGSLLVVPVAAYLVSKPEFVSTYAAPVSAGAFILYIMYESAKATPVERHGVYVILILAMFSIAFWGAFEQAGSSISLFTDRFVNRMVGDHELKASQFQAVNAIYIVLLAPIFSWMWVRLGKVNINPSSALKFVLALIQVGFGFLFLVWAARQAQATGSSAMYLLLLAYFFHTTGELCISPVGLSMITKMAPARLGGMLMGFWFLTTSFGQILAGWLASKQQAWGFGTLFFRIMIGSIAAGLLLFVLYPAVKKWEKDKLAEHAAH